MRWGREGWNDGVNNKGGGDGGIIEREVVESGWDGRGEENRW